MNPHGDSSSLLRNRVRFCSLSTDDVAYCSTRPGFYGLDLERRFIIITWSQMGAVTLTVLRPPCWTVHVTRVIAMFTCRTLVLRMDRSWKDSAFMALGFCLHHSVGVMWAPHQLNEPFSHFWSTIFYIDAVVLVLVCWGFHSEHIYLDSFRLVLGSCFNCFISPTSECYIIES
jgi:hypothetical protein